MHNCPSSPPPKPRRTCGHDASPAAYRVASPPTRECTRAPVLIAETGAFFQPPASRNRKIQLFFAATSSLSCIAIVTGMFLDYITDTEPLTFLDIVTEPWVQNLVLVAALVVAVAAVTSLCNPGGYGERSAATAIARAGAIIAYGRIVDLTSFGMIAALGQDASVGPGLWMMFGDALILSGAGTVARSSATCGWADDSSGPLWRTVWMQSKAVAAGPSKPRREAEGDHRTV